MLDDIEERFGTKGKTTHSSAVQLVMAELKFFIVKDAQL